MENQINCTLCSSLTFPYKQLKKRDFNRCPYCDAIILNPKYYLSPEREKSRYEIHNNDINDIKYQQFVSPVVEAVLNTHSDKDKGLDFGAGTGPVASALLKEKGYILSLYDPYFLNDINLLKLKYDYIICCEVVEHFYNPKKEFHLLSSLLNTSGSLIIMTNIFNNEIDFVNWSYKNDSTHVFFYTAKTFEYIKKTFNFKSLTITNRLIVLKK